MNQAQGLATLYLIKDTEMDEKTFYEVFQKDNIVGIKPLEVTLSNGSVHKFSVADIFDLIFEQFEKGEEDKEKATDGEISDKIAM
jgi:lipoate-protein ligase A